MSDTTRFTLHVDVDVASAERAHAAFDDDSPTGMLNIVSGGLRWHGISARVTMSDTPNAEYARVVLDVLDRANDDLRPGCRIDPKVREDLAVEIALAIAAQIGGSGGSDE